MFQAILVTLCLAGSLATEFEMDMNNFLQSGLVMSERTFADSPVPESITMAPEPTTTYGCSCTIIENAGNCAYRYKCRCGCSEQKCLAGESPISPCQSKLPIKCPRGTLCLPVYSRKDIVGTGCCSYSSAMGAMAAPLEALGGGNKTGKGKRTLKLADTGCEPSEVSFGECFDEGKCGPGLHCSDKNFCCGEETATCSDNSAPLGECIQPGDQCGPGFKCETKGAKKFCCISEESGTGAPGNQTAP